MFDQAARMWITAGLVAWIICFGRSAAFLFKRGPLFAFIASAAMTAAVVAGLYVLRNSDELEIL